MAAVARKLNALALSQGDEAKLAHEVATSAELGALEAQASEAALAKAIEQQQLQQPVSPVASSSESIPAVPDTGIKN